MNVQILGGGCPNCEALAANATEAAKTLGLTIEIEKITDSDTILEMGVLRTPAYAIDGVVQQAGKVAGVDAIVEALKAAGATSA